MTDYKPCGVFYPPQLRILVTKLYTYVGHDTPTSWEAIWEQQLCIRALRMLDLLLDSVRRMLKFVPRKHARMLWKKKSVCTLEKKKSVFWVACGGSRAKTPPLVAHLVSNGPGQFLGSWVIRALTTRVVQWSSWVLVTQERKTVKNKKTWTLSAWAGRRGQKTCWH